MSFFPREEYVPRRGVAMKIVEPNPNLKLGSNRDERVTQEAQKFADQEFILARAMSDKAPKQSKVKTFKSDSIPWATGNGNVIAPKKPEPVTYQRIIGQRVPDEMVAQFYHGDSIIRERHAQQDIMEHCRSFADSFSPQKEERMHKILPRPVLPTAKLEPITGFNGLGMFTRERPIGKGQVSDHTYDPLGMRNWAPRISGLKRLPQSNFCSLEDGSLQYTDNITFESTQKKTFPTPHRHEFPTNYGPESDMQGFKGLGTADVPEPPHGRKHSEKTYVSKHAVSMTHRPAAQSRPISTEPAGWAMPKPQGTQLQQPARSYSSMDAHPHPGVSILYHPARH